MDVRTAMRSAVAFNRDRPAMITETQTLTFGEAWTRGVRLANALRELGARPGDRVASLEDNTLAAADFLLGAAIAGVVRVPLYARNSADAHQHMLAHTQCRIVVTDEIYAGTLDGMQRNVPGLAHIVVRDEKYESWLASHSDQDPDVAIDDDDWYVIRHSGGTTGRSKGVGYTHHDWLVVCRNWFYPLERLKPDSVVGHAGPITHGSGYLFIPGWLHGVPNLLFGEFEGGKVLSMMARHRVSHMFAVPTMLQAFSAHPSARALDWSALKAVIVGGAPITDRTAMTAHEIFGDCLYQGFGQTEAIGLTFMDSKEWFGEVPGSTPMRSAGRVAPFAQVEIRDEQNRTLPIGEEGEIVTRVEGQMRGYWDDPELTATRLVDGWVHTGDIGRLDANGFLYVLDRADDMIISGGFNIWPAELETTIADHPAVVEVAVFAVPDEKWGEAPMAVCVVKDADSVTAEEIITLCRERLGSYKKPARVEFMTEPLPRTVVGKVMRKAMREAHWAGRDSRIAGG